jgi:hypothetical protein
MSLGQKIAAALAVLAFPLASISAGPDLKPASVKSVTDANVPYVVFTDGFVVLGVEFNSLGKIVEIDPLRDPGGLAKTASAAVRTWKFSPARFDGNRIASMMTVAFAYRPSGLLYLAPKPLPDFSYPPPTPDPHDVEKSAYTTPRIVSVAYPQYPVRAVRSASVIVQVSLDATGAVQDTQVLYDMATFTQLSLEAIPFWKFEPARWRGAPVPSKVVIAFVFQPPPSSSF